MLETKVHTELRGFLRQQKQPMWTHHLTMARLVSRALRLHRSALIQTGSTVSCYSYSYLTPALLSEQPLLLIAPSGIQKRLLEIEIPKLQQWLQIDKPIFTNTSELVVGKGQGLVMLSPEQWLSDRLSKPNTLSFPTLIDQAEDLGDWTKAFLTVRLTPSNWEELIGINSLLVEKIRQIRIKLTKSLFSHPPNPYHCYLLDEGELRLLEELRIILGDQPNLTPHFRQFYRTFSLDTSLSWGQLRRDQGTFILSCQPIEIASFLNPLWPQQPFVLMGGFLDQSKEANLYKTTMGLMKQDLLCLKFTPSRQNEYIRLYLPEKLPLPNTPEFQGVLTNEINHLIGLCQPLRHPIVILVEDLPLQSQLGAFLAAQWGSKVKIEKPLTDYQGILLCSWQFWHQYAENCPSPQLLIMATLPIPSLENPLVAGQVIYYKRQHKDWFRGYLLPTALKQLQQAVMPLRETQGVVALLDNRANLRSYGRKVLDALDPYAKVSYLDPDFLQYNQP
ncbi:MAG: helicase C-terminal domain-containing protein [Microcystaceae cyanobacterium]